VQKGNANSEKRGHPGGKTWGRWNAKERHLEAIFLDLYPGWGIGGGGVDKKEKNSQFLPPAENQTTLYLPELGAQRAKQLDHGEKRAGKRVKKKGGWTWSPGKNLQSEGRKKTGMSGSRGETDKLRRERGEPSWQKKDARGGPRAT